MSYVINNLLFKFANSFDLKDWEVLKTILADQIECDYQALRGTSETLNSADFIDSRKQALDHLKTQHLFSNLEITEHEKTAFCRLNAIIYRQDNAGKRFDSHVFYEFGLVKLQHDQWRINKIKQTVFWNDGDASIHKGVVRL